MRVKIGFGAALVLLIGTVVDSVGHVAAAEQSSSVADFSDAGPSLVAKYLEAYFATFPSRATTAGWHARDHELEDLSPGRRSDWLEFNRRIVGAAEAALAGELGIDDRLDLDLLLRQARRIVFDWEVLDLPGRSPLFWTGMLSNSTVFLLVRDDAPLDQRLDAATSRAHSIPRLAGQARAALAATSIAAPAAIAPELARMAAGQARASATFFQEGFPKAGGEERRVALTEAGAPAAEALTDLASFLEELATKAEEAGGSPRLGAHYAERFRLVTGVELPIAKVLARAGEALAAKRRETAEYGRSVWKEIFAERDAPGPDRELIAALFKRISEDRAGSVDEFVADYRTLIDGAVDFVRENDVLTLPEPLTLEIGRSPSYFIGQSVGGVYAAGPFASEEAETLLFLPTLSSRASGEQRDAFFRDFNHHFNVMITPHEVIPGHYLQLKFAARHPRKIRALFGDGVYIEGWGTFCERLMLDLGWGGPLDRLAHLKKQLENIARTIVDIRVHTTDVTRDEVLLFVREEALQDEQFAANMWRRSITSAPQLTFYFQGYDQVYGLYEDVRKRLGEEFSLKAFLDGMMEDGPVPVAHYREKFLIAEVPQEGDGVGSDAADVEDGRTRTMRRIRNEPTGIVLLRPRSALRRLRAAAEGG